MNGRKFQENILRIPYGGSRQKPARYGCDPQTARLIFQYEIGKDCVFFLIFLFSADGTDCILVFRTEQGNFRQLHVGQFMGIAQGCNAYRGKNQKKKQP